MDKKYSDLAFRDDEGVPLYLFTDEPEHIGFRTRMGERAYLDRDQVIEVQRFLKKWLKNNKPKTEVIEGSTNPEPEANLDLTDAIRTLFYSIFGDQSVPEEAIEADLVLNTEASTDAEYILTALQQHEGLANSVAIDALKVIASAIADEDNCAHYAGSYKFSWVIDPLRGKVVTVRSEA